MTNPRDQFYINVVDARISNKHASILICGGGSLDKETFINLGFTNVTVSNLDTRASVDEFAPYKWDYQDAQSLSYDDNSFDKVFLFSPSRQTLPLDKLKLDESRIFDKYSDDTLEEIIDAERDDVNNNNLIIIDDSIKQIKNRPGFHRLILNRRHITHNCAEEGQAGLSIIVLSQKYNCLDLIARTNMSDVILFRTENAKERRAIKDELMSDLSPAQQDEVLRTAWDQKYSFLLIKAYLPTADRYYRRFDKIIIKDDDDDCEEE